MKGIIWYWHDAEMAKDRLKEIIKCYERIGIQPIMQRGVFRETKRDMRVQFSNQDIWEVYPARESARGKACNIGYISYSIPKDMVDFIVMPCIKSFPYQAYRYWHEEPVIAANTIDNPESQN